NRAEDVHAYVNTSPDKNNIHFTGYVEKEALPILYREASLYALPSFYEGFGIPMLEAMSSAVPLVCSNTSCLPEIGGDAVLTFDPNSSNDICKNIKSVLENVLQAQLLVAKGLERVKQFNWSKHAQRIVAEYEYLAGGK
ncbi:MAG: glycosyltransferase, partial [Lentisphaeraceae bacterium]|nr:glycosyltransferase [Lentisphaeraceae bacterium]